MIREAITGMILNGLGFSDRPMSLTPQFFQNKPLAVLFRPGVEADHFNRFKLGRSLDKVFGYGCDVLFSEISMDVCRQELLIEQDDGVLIFDDTIQEKPYTDENDLICWHYDHSQNRTVKGINLLNCVYHASDVSLPVTYELITKPVLYTDVKTRLLSRQAQEPGHKK